MAPGLNRFIALLRAINVGGHTVRMDRLRALFEEVGTNVETFIASGNVIFDSTSRGARALETRIEAHLEAALGYPVSTFLRTPAELRRIADSTPFPQADAAAGIVYVAFTGRVVSDVAAAGLLKLGDEVHAFQVEGREIYWLRRRRDAPYEAPPIERVLGAPMTMRNMNTIRRLAAKYAP